MHEGRMITSDEGDYIRNLASSQALRAWSARPVMGAMAGVQRDLAPAAGHVGAPLDAGRTRPSQLTPCCPHCDVARL